jgi:hypothetical protein
MSELYKSEEWLRRQYWELEYSLQDIADLAGCTRKNVEYWMRKFGIERRDNQTKYTRRLLSKISETSKGRPSFSKGLTKHEHPSLLRISEKLSGSNNPQWKGGSYLSHGYRFIYDPNHPLSNRQEGYVLEHRLVMEFLIGRLLTDDEVVHHRDAVRHNNLSCNLFLFPNHSAHTGFHMFKLHKNPLITEEQFMSEVYTNAS